MFIKVQKKKKQSWALLTVMLGSVIYLFTFGCAETLLLLGLTLVALSWSYFVAAVQGLSIVVVSLVADLRL